MYTIDVTVHNCETNIDAVETLHQSDLYAAVAMARSLEMSLGASGFVSIKYQPTDRSGFTVLERIEWAYYL